MSKLFLKDKPNETEEGDFLSGSWWWSMLIWALTGNCNLTDCYIPIPNDEKSIPVLLVCGNNEALVVKKSVLI